MTTKRLGLQGQGFLIGFLHSGFISPLSEPRKLPTPSLPKHSQTLPIGSIVVPFIGLYSGSYKVIPKKDQKRNYYRAPGSDLKPMCLQRRLAKRFSEIRPELTLPVQVHKEHILRESEDGLGLRV